MKKIFIIIVSLNILIACSPKTRSLKIESKTNVCIDKLIEVKITRNQTGNIQTNNSTSEYLNYYLYYIDNDNEIKLPLSEKISNNNCENEIINIQNGNKLTNIFYRNIEFKKEANFIYIYINCIPEIYTLPSENNELIQIKFKIEDKENIQIKDSIIYNLKTH